MNTPLKEHLDELNIAKAIVFHGPPYAVGIDELRLQCDEILAACAPQPNSLVVMVVEEIVDAVSGLVDIGAEQRLVSRELKSTAEVPRGSTLHEFAERLDRLTAESNGEFGFLLSLLSNLVDEST